MRASAENVFVTHNLIRVMPTEGNIYSFLEISPSVAFADGVFSWLSVRPARRGLYINNIEAPECVKCARVIQNYFIKVILNSRRSRAALSLKKQRNELNNEKKCKKRNPCNDFNSDIDFDMDRHIRTRAYSKIHAARANYGVFRTFQKLDNTFPARIRHAF